MPKLTFQWNSVPKLTLGAEVHRLVPKLFRVEVTRAEHRLPHSNAIYLRYLILYQCYICIQTIFRIFHKLYCAVRYVHFMYTCDNNTLGMSLVGSENDE